MNDNDALRRATVAAKILKDCGIDLAQDFHELPTRQVEKLLYWAGKEKYRKPRDANGSRARYYHQRLMRDLERWQRRLEHGVFYRSS